MNFLSRFSDEQKECPFASYQEYTEYLFACANRQLSRYIEGLMRVFAAENGGFKNVLYPDIEVAHDLCEKNLLDFSTVKDQAEEPQEFVEEDLFGGMELEELFAEFSQQLEVPKAETENELSLEEALEYVRHRASLTDQQTTPLPLYRLMSKLEFSPFTEFAFACALLSSTQTSYASVFQVINQNGGLSAPSIESAGRVFFAEDYSITGAYGQMSLALEQLGPVLSMRINDSMPFSTLLSPDKRVIDFLFSPNPLRVDENYSRFFARLPEATDPFIANKQVLDAININYDDGGKLFNLFGDDGSGRKFMMVFPCWQQTISTTLTPPFSAV